MVKRDKQKLRKNVYKKELLKGLYMREDIRKYILNELGPFKKSMKVYGGERPQTADDIYGVSVAASNVANETLALQSNVLSARHQYLENLDRAQETLLYSLQKYHQKDYREMQKIYNRAYDATPEKSGGKSLNRADRETYLKKNVKVLADYDPKNENAILTVFNNPRSDDYVDDKLKDATSDEQDFAQQVHDSKDGKMARLHNKIANANI